MIQTMFFFFSKMLGLFLEEKQKVSLSREGFSNSMDYFELIDSRVYFETMDKSMKY